MLAHKCLYGNTPEYLKDLIKVKVSVNENFSTLHDFVFFLDFWHEWVLNFNLAEKENQKVLFNPSKMSLS